MDQVIEIGVRKVGSNERTLIIAEVGQAHDGDLAIAHSYIDAAADSGVDAIKFQTHIASAETTPHEQWRVKFSKKDATRYDYWKRMEFELKEWQELKKHADERGLIFLSSPFSHEAVDLLMDIGVSVWKVASGEVCNFPLLKYMAETGLPVLLSSGMSGMEELGRAVDCVRTNGSDVGVFQCTTAYPCPPEKVGLNNISIFKERFGCPVGLSDHSGEIYPSFAAVTLGATMLEFHIAFGKEASYGPDASSSLIPEQVNRVVEGVRFFERMVAAPVDKDGMAKELQPLRDLFTKSVVAVKDIPAGTVLEGCHLALKKPGSGIPAQRISEVLGKTLVRDIHADDLLSENDYE